MSAVEDFHSVMILKVTDFLDSMPHAFLLQIALWPGEIASIRQKQTIAGIDNRINLHPKFATW